VSFGTDEQDFRSREEISDKEKDKDSKRNANWVFSQD
jgi:hypothetical protein